MAGRSISIRRLVKLKVSILKESKMPSSTKQDKRTVKYSLGKPDSHCSICSHFDVYGKCSLVAGNIDPMYWCTLFAKKRGKVQAAM